MNKTSSATIKNNFVLKKKYKKKFKYSHLLFVIPAMALNSIFFVYPFFQSIVMSLYDWPLIGERVLLGLGNYIKLFNDSNFWSSLWFTIKYTIMITPGLFILGLCLALLINSRLKINSLFRAIYFAPVVISMVASSLMWLWIYNDIYGLLNYYLLAFNFVSEPVNWMGSSSTSLPAVSFMIVWKMAGFTMIILLSGLQSIPEEVYESSKTDGANKMQQLFYITLPLLKPSIGLSLIISVIGSVLAFEQFLIMTNGGPASSTTTAVHYIYNTSFKYFDFGYGSAMTVILLIILAVFSIFQVRMLRNPGDT